MAEGFFDGDEVGTLLLTTVGLLEGFFDGKVVGYALGDNDGLPLGLWVG